MKNNLLVSLSLLMCSSAFAMGIGHTGNTWYCITSGSSHYVHHTSTCHPSFHNDCIDDSTSGYEDYLYWSDDQSIESHASQQVLAKCRAQDPVPAQCDAHPECHFVN